MAERSISSCDDDITHPLVVTTEALESYSEDVACLWTAGYSIPILEKPPSSLVFLRDYVAMSRPCIMRNTILVSNNKGGKAAEPAAFSGKEVEEEGQSQQQQQHHYQKPLTLSLDELVALADPNLLLTVDVTPDGHGDCLRMVKQQQQQTQPATTTTTTSGEEEQEEEDESNVARIQAMFVKPQECPLKLSDFRSRLRASQRYGWQQSVVNSSCNNGCGGADDSLAVEF